MADLLKKQSVLDIIHNFFFEIIETTPTTMTEDGEVYDLKIVEPLLEMNKELSNRIKSL